MGDIDPFSDSDSEVQGLGSRKILHPIHIYFIYNKEKDQNVCKHCSDTIRNKNPTNLVNHLKKKNSIHFVKGKLIHYEEYIERKATFDKLKNDATSKKRKKKPLSPPKTKQRKITDVSYCYFLSY